MKLSVAVSLMAGGVTTAVGGQAPLVTLPPADAVLERQFTRINAVRELPDRSLLISDPLEGVLIHAVFEQGLTVEIGRKGGGPGEFHTPGWLYGLNGDTTLFTDSYTGRWNILSGSRWVTSYSEARVANRLVGASVAGADRQGRVAGSTGFRYTSGTPQTRETADSLYVVLADIAGGEVDTVAAVRGSGGRGFVMLPARANRMASLVIANPLAAGDQVLLFGDGWLAVAYVDPYRVDWRRPDGRWLRGTPLPFEVIPVDRSEQCAVLARWGRQFDPCDPGELPGWPQHLPPFLTREFTNRAPPLLATSDGELVIRRTLRAGGAVVRYDVISRASRLMRTVELTPREWLIAFGRGVVYVASPDEFDLVSIRRHRWER